MCYIVPEDYKGQLLF